MSEESIEILENRVSDVCSRETAVVAAYVFGSVVKGKSGSYSDLDVAVLLDERHRQEFSVPSFISDMEKATGGRVDLVVLNRADEIVKREVRRSGRLVFERDPQVRKRFEISSRKSYEDFLYLHRRYVRKVLYGKRNGG
ncbi:MAG: nucleotidyltransferase domain-containing protein [Deltaproteobacteria bacterium]|nr:nucleotidyltransferase domain-containing protein [Deltaproteobacteria bacterium]